jgi:hypothetical protein
MNLLCETAPCVVRTRLADRRHDFSDADGSSYLQASRRWEAPGEKTSRHLSVLDTSGGRGQALEQAILELRGTDLL